MAISARDQEKLHWKNPYTITELNKGARHYGFTGWFDPLLKNNENATANIRRQLGKFDGIWRTPLTTAERVARATSAVQINSWASLTKEFPDFEEAMKEYLDTKTNKPSLKKINKLKISSEAKFNKMTGSERQFIIKYNRKQFQLFKNTKTISELEALSNFKDIRSLVRPVTDKLYNYKNGVVVLDEAFSKATRAKDFQDYLKKEGIERLKESPWEKDVKSKGSGIIKGRWKLTDKAIKEGKTFASILAAYPNLRSEPSAVYNNILAKVSRNHPIYQDTQQGLRSLFNFVKDNINSDLKLLKPKALKTLVANNPGLLRQVTGYIDPASNKIKYQGLDGLKNLSTSEILNRARLVTEHNRPMRDYAAKYMDPARLKVLFKNLRSIDADWSHNISMASQWYNNSLKENATRVAQANKNNPELLEHLSGEFKKMNQRFYVDGKFYGAEVATSPSYRTSVIGAWRNNLKGIGLEKLWDKYSGQYNLKGFGTVDDIMSRTLKDSTALKQLGAFFGCPGTFKTFDEGGRVRLQAGGQGLVQCVETKLKQPGAMEKVAQLPEEVSGTLGKIKNVARGFLGALGKWGPKVGKYGAVVAAGALAQPAVDLVRQFMNDDPTTYLTDPDQQEGMLLATLEAQERPKPRNEILDWGIGAGAVGATAATIPGTRALWKARRLPTLKRAGMGMPRAAMGPLMKYISGMYTPAGLLATEPLRIAQKRSQGEGWGEIAKDPTMWMGPAFAPGMTRLATAGMKSKPLLAKALRLGMSKPALKLLGRTGGYGLLASLGLTGYDKYQDWKNKRGWFAKD